MAEKSERRIASEENISIGMNIKNARMKKGFSQEQLAEILDITNTHISYLETDTKYPSFLNFLNQYSKTATVSS
jgi:transcriptional regulator with XRE-family HTH domain